VYRESSVLEGLLTDVLGDAYPCKEVLVVIDRPTEMSLDTVKKFQDKASFVLNNERVGKVNALNEAYKRTTGNILLFLDSDVRLQSSDASFFGILEKEMEGVDILDLKKSVVRRSFLDKLIHYEYLGSSLVSWFFSKRIGKSLGLNGAAFAIRRKAFESLGGFRKTIPDDFDLVTRSFFNNFKFRYTDRIAVSIKPQNGWKEWYKQRVRWGIATGVWLKDYYRPLAKILVQKPQIVFSSLLLLLPAFLLFFLSLLLPQAFYNNFFTFASTVLLRYSSFALPSFHLPIVGNLVAKNGVVIIFAYSAFSSIFYVAARKLRYYFNPLEFLCYYLIYSPLSLLMFVIGIVRVMTRNDRIDIDWKI